jgi:hypothetical protein
VTKKYQTTVYDTSAPAAEMAVPERVSVAMGLRPTCARACSLLRSVPACR